VSHWRPKYVPPSSSKKVVNATIAASLGIAFCKYVAALFTGSPAMLAEAVHSTIDSGNESLLLLGMRRSQRRADTLHPFGHGKVLYFYSFLVGKGGRIVFISSNIADHAALPMTSLYSMAKSGLDGLCKGMARDLGPKEITVNTVHPGPISTDANPENGPYSKQLKSFMATPKYGRAEDVAAWWHIS